MVIKVVLPGEYVVVVEAVHDGAVVVILRQHGVGAPPGLGRAVGEEGIEVALIARLERSLVVQFAGAALHLVEIAVGQAVLFEELSILLLDAEVEALEVIVVLVGSAVGLTGALDDAEVHVVRVVRRHSCQLEQPEARAFE